MIMGAAVHRYSLNKKQQRVKTVSAGNGVKKLDILRPLESLMSQMIRLGSVHPLAATKQRSEPGVRTFRRRQP